MRFGVAFTVSILAISPGVAMSAYLHGGGVPFVADKSIAEIDKDLRDSRRKAPAEIVFSAISGGPAMQRAQIAVRVSPDGAKAQRQDVALFLMLGSGNAPPPVDGDPKFYLRIVPEAKTGAQPSEASLKALADAMAKRPPPTAVSGIPAAYTYFGQFLAHDISWMKRPEDYNREVNFRTSALDLDSLFGPNAEGAVAAGTNLCSGGLALGKTRGGGFDDLPRAANGFPALPDPRNDNNLAVAQMTVAIIKFHMRVCQLLPDLSPAEQQTVTARHIQAVTLYDYLPRIIHPDVYRDVMENGRKVIFEGKGAPEFFQVPLEFAAACFRFGHAMVRLRYDWGTAGEHDPESLMRLTHHVFLSSTNMLTDEWIAEWDGLGAAKDQRDSQSSSRIGAHLVRDLSRLGRKWVGKDIIAAEPHAATFNLAELTLRRGRELALASGEELRSCVTGTCGRHGIPEITDQQMFEILAGDTSETRDGLLAELSGRTPLWFYTLREAELHGCGGEHLGPLGSRIVAETLHAAVQSAKGNILSCAPFTVLPGLEAEGPTKFSFRNLIAASRRIEIEH